MPHPASGLVGAGLRQGTVGGGVPIPSKPLSNSNPQVGLVQRNRTLLARDAIFVSTIASVPVIVAASTWLR